VDAEWILELVGDGTQLSAAKSAANSLGLTGNVVFTGRLAPEEAMDRVARASVFLMTSHPGYEGYPRVLVEALASGVPAVVTEGSDTGGLVSNGSNGFVTGRLPEEIAHRVILAQQLPPEAARLSVSRLGAPEVIARIFESNGI
jgi:glycosyltransferase involved in cell wall biosynthesis